MQNKKLNKKMSKKLREILEIQSESYNQWRMFAYIIRQLKAKGVKYYVHDGNIHATKGVASGYPCVVAHMDTVHDIEEDLSVLQVGDKLTGFNRVTMKQSGIGGDDKVGIYIALQCLDVFDNIKLAFFRDEEVGCNGSSRCDKSFFDDCNFVLQCDRQGNKDFVDTACGTKLSSRAFQKTINPILKKYGYSFKYGGMTDVMQLKDDGVNVSCANMSCGYWNPHTKHEYVDTTDVERCLKMVTEIIKTHGNTRFEHTPVKTWKYDKSWIDEYWDQKDGKFKKIGSEDKKVKHHWDPSTKSWKARDYTNDHHEDWYYDDVSPKTVDVRPKKRIDEVSPDECQGCGRIHPLAYFHEYNMWICNDCATFFK